MAPTIHRLSTCTSTNAVALDFAKSGATHGTVVVSKEQTKGRGRQGRTWLTTENSLAFSLLLRPNIPVALAYRLTFITAVALREALQEFGIEAYIKWPNDMLIRSADNSEVPLLGPFRKVAGILVEISSVGPKIDAAVIGIGVNIRPSSPSHGLKSLPQAGFLSDAGFAGDEEVLLSTILAYLKNHFDQIKSTTHWSHCLEKIRLFSATLNRKITLQEGDNSVSGMAITIRDDGSLQLREASGAIKNIYAGDVCL